MRAGSQKRGVKGTGKPPALAEGIPIPFVGSERDNDDTHIQDQA